MAKPTEDPKWVTSEDPQHIIEPTAPQKLNGILSGGIWGREYLNWMFFAISKWIDWVRSNAMDKDNNLSELANKATAFGEIKQSATTSATGVVELATGAEVATGTDTTRAITPSTLLSRTSTTARVGLVQLATGTEVQAGTDTTKAITPSTLYSNTATDSRRGVVELATNTETQTGTDTSRAVTPANLSSRTATTTRTGLVEKATTAEMTAGATDKFPDAAVVKTFVEASAPDRDPIVVWSGAADDFVTASEMLADTGHVLQVGTYHMKTNEVPVRYFSVTVAQLNVSTYGTGFSIGTGSGMNSWNASYDSSNQVRVLTTTSGSTSAGYQPITEVRFVPI